METQQSQKLKKRWLHLLIALITIGSVGLIYVLWPRAAYKEVHNFDQCVRADYTVNNDDPQVCTDPKGHKFTNTPTTSGVAAAQTNLLFDTLVISTDGPIKPERTVINNQADWQAFWLRTHAHLAFKSNIIPVDFTKKAVIAVVDGQYPSAGYYTKITQVAQQFDIVLVSIHQSTPPKDCKVPGAPVSPYHIIQIDKVNLPVRFTIETTTLQANCIKK